MKNLLIASIGTQSKHPQWLFGENRNFDFIALCFEPVENQLLREAVDVFERKGYKFSNVKAYWLKKKHILNSYDFIFMPDDDLEMGAQDINLLFDIAAGFNLDLCQPSLTLDSIPSWPITLWGGNPQIILRMTNFVEIMCPLFSQSTFQVCIETFGHNILGTGLDFIWPKLLNFQNIAIVDAVQARHARLPRNWSSVVDSNKEWEIAHRLFNVEIYEHQTLGMVLQPI